MKRDLSIIIPARNEEFLGRTIQGILENIEGNTELIVVLDGQWAHDPIPQHERLTIIFNPVSVGQRAATNQGASISQAKYIMKCDAHVIFDKGFDVKMMNEMQDDWTMVPTMYNLHAFDWVCYSCKERTYQGPKPEYCLKCRNVEFERDIVWKPRWSRKTMFYRFDKELRFKYWGALGHRPESQGDIAETMCLLGACWMLTREKYWELNICDEGHGSWGQQGVEVSCKTWLSGGRLVVNKKTWFSHLFRTQEGFSFPYPNPGVEEAREYSRDLWLNDKWEKAIHPLSWLVEKFSPVPDWHTTKGILYYTDNRLDQKLMSAVQKQIQLGAEENRIVSVSLKPIEFGENIVMDLERGYLTMAKQILAGLEKLDTDIVFFAEHDVLYHPTHFNFTPPDTKKYYYNTNVWRVRATDGHALWCNDLQQLSGLVAYRELLIKHFKEKVKRIEKDGFSRAMGFEPGTHNRPERIDDFKAESFKSDYPNLDIRHDLNLTESRWKKEEFRNEKYTEGWLEAEYISGWGRIKNNFDVLLNRVQEI